MQSLFSTYPHLTTCPLALVSWQDFSGDVNWRVVDWVGIVCGKSSRLSFAVTGCSGGLALLRENAEFAVNVPSDEMLSTLKRSGQISSDDSSGSAEFIFTRGTVINSPCLAECPVIFECRVSEISEPFERTLVAGDVAAVHVGGRVYRSGRRLDVCGLHPFARHWFEKDPLAE